MNVGPEESRFRSCIRKTIKNQSMINFKWILYLSKRVIITKTNCLFMKLITFCVRVSEMKVLEKADLTWSLVLFDPSVRNATNFYLLLLTDRNQNPQVIK